MHETIGMTTLSGETEIKQKQKKDIKKGKTLDKIFIVVVKRINLF